jgi:NAD(P)-dependent dehydrogenase (short-subunit alcohol dehydrogenase family)
LTIAITGTTRGIGAALAKKMRGAGENVLSLGRGENCIHVDLENASSIEALETKLNNIPIDLLVCNAGIFIDRDQDLNYGYKSDLWIKTFSINVISVFLLIQKTLPNIIAGKGKIAIIASQMGSQRKASGGDYIYRASKAAVINLGRNLAKDLSSRRIPVGIYHPGWVKTDMGGAKADISVEEAASGLMDRFSELTMKKTGCFETWDGKKHPL